MRFKTIILIVTLAVLMLAGVAVAKEDEDKYKQRIEALEAIVADLQAQVAALTGAVGSVQTQANEIATDGKKWCQAYTFDRYFALRMKEGGFKISPFKFLIC